MKKLLVSLAIGVTSFGAYAQGYSFSLLSSVTNTTVGGGVIDYTAAPGFTITGDQQLQISSNFNFTISNFNIGQYNLNLVEAVLHLLDGKPIGVDAFYDSPRFDQNLGQIQEVFYLRGSNTFRQDSYSLSNPPSLGEFYRDNGTVIFAPAVPEPETYALLLGGLTLIVAARRYRARPTGGN